MKLPESLFKEWTALASGARFWGVPIEEFSKEELIAISAYGWKQLEEMRNQGARDRSFLLGISYRRSEYGNQGNAAASRVA